MISVYLSSFLSTKRCARLHLPYNGSLGSRFAIFSAFLTLGLRYYVPLRLPFLHLGSLRFRLASQYLACFRLRLCSSRLIGLAGNTSTNARLIYRPAYLRPVSLSKEITVLSSSQATPLNTCPAHRSRWCLRCLPVASKTIAFRSLENVGFP